MAMFSVAGRSTGAGSTTLPLFSLYSVAGTAPRVREIGIFNTTSTSAAYSLVKITTAGTQGAALTEVEWDEDGSPPLCTAFQTHSSTGPTLGSPIRQVSLGAAIGSGVIWTFGANGLKIPVGTSNGIGIVVATGTGQIVDFYIDWEE